MAESQRTRIRSYRELKIWQRSMDLTVQTYELTRRFPSEEKYGLSSQMRRAAASVPANIAEGQARRSKKEFLQMLSIARGSLAELETFVTLSERLDLIRRETSNSLLEDCAEINRMMNGLMRSLANRG
ncbi:MAG: four helix bundle protein [Caldilineaceae bacterium]|nr:four helix bundle protein [Caldilineaceae bacterium]